LLTKNYGQRLLGALPVFPISQPEAPAAKLIDTTPKKTVRRKRVSKK
jgi:ATP-dependent DNA helicase DinG